MLAQQLERCGLVVLRDDAAEAAAHVEDLVHLLVGNSAPLLDQVEDRRHRQRVVDLVADLGAEAQQVAEAARGDVGEAVDVTPERSSSSTGLT